MIMRRIFEVARRNSARSRLGAKNHDVEHPPKRAGRKESQDSEDKSLDSGSAMALKTRDM